MATIQERKTDDGKTTYRVQVRLKGYPPQTATFSRITDARRWAQQVESAIREGRHFKTAESKKHTLKDLIDRYIDDVIPLKKNYGSDQKQTRRRPILPQNIKPLWKMNLISSKWI